jgi:hypothetical protein
MNLPIKQLALSLVLVIFTTGLQAQNNIYSQFRGENCSGIASPSGWTDDYNRDSYPANSFHHWTGTINLVKGKK